jgi:hypothetical protein
MTGIAGDDELDEAGPPGVASRSRIAAWASPTQRGDAA